MIFITFFTKDPDIEEQLKFLEKTIDPWDKVEKYWEGTWETRKQDYLLRKQTISSYLALYPAATVNAGLELVRKCL